MSEEIVYPKKKPRRQRLCVVGHRKEGEPAFIPCRGICSAPGVLWTRHLRLQGCMYECAVCGMRRPWGLQYWEA